MKIKTVKKMNLPELIQHVWKNKLYPTEIKNDGGRFRVKFGQNALVSIIDCRGIEGRVDVPMDINFTVEVEEIVTQTTRFDELTEYIYDSNDDHHFTAEHKGANISLIIDCETHQFKTQAIYCKDTLVWTKEHGIPESGVLEVDAE